MNATAKARTAEAGAGAGSTPDPAAAAFVDGWRANLEAEVARYIVIVDDLHAQADRAAAKHDALVAASEANLNNANQMADDGDAFLQTLNDQLHELEGN